MIVSKRTVPSEKERVDRGSLNGSPSDRRATGSSSVVSDPSQSSPDLAVGISSASRWWKRIALGVTSLCAGIGTASLVLISPFPFSAQNNHGFLSLFQQTVQYPVTRPINILFMGIDRVPGEEQNPALRFSGRSDTLLVIRVDPQAESASILSIPRDTQVQIPQVGLAKINEANADGGPALARDVVSQTLNQLPLDRYVRVSTAAFRELIDELGGVEVFVPKPMQYVDETQKLHIDLKPGLQRLNGDQAEQFVRFRHDSLGDIGRVQRQQVLLQAIRARLTSPDVIPRIPGVMQVLQKYIDTNLSSDEMISLAQMALKIDQKQVRMVMLPGRFGTAEENTASYWLMNDQARDRVLQTYFHHTTTPAATASPVVSVPVANLQHLNIAVQNASGTMGMGTQVADQLKAQGFSNVYVIEDWPEPIANSEIIAQQGDLPGAQSLQKLLKLSKVETTSTGDIESDFTIRVGQDWVQPPSPAITPTP